jgi:hypothetical protein
MRFREILFKPKIQRKLDASKSGIGFVVPDQWIDFARLCKIRSGVNFVFFDPYYYQRIFVEVIQSHKFTICAKTRQLGVTETVANFMVWKALKNEGYVGVILSKNQNDTSAIAKRVKKQLFPFISKNLISFQTDSLTDLEIKGGGRLLFRNSSPNGIRGVESVSDVLLDEWGFVEDAEQIFEAVIPTLEMVEFPRVIIASTPNGRNGHFYNLINDRELDRHIAEIRGGFDEPFRHWSDESGSWARVLIHWKAHPIFSLIEGYLEKKMTELKMSQASAQREFNLSFDDSDQSLFSFESISNAAIGDYEPPDKTKNYYFGIDTATIGDDFFVGLMLSEQGGFFSVVALYRQRKASMTRNLDGLSLLIEEYKPVKIGIETTGGVGQLYLEKLAAVHPSTIIVAIKTTAESKAVMIERSIHAHEKRVITYPLGIISDEHKSFIRKENKSLEASGNNHDDTVMGLAFALSISPFGTNDELLHIPTFKN